MTTMKSRYFKVDTTTSYIVAITVGSSASPGYDSILQAPDKRHIGIGWSLVNGEYVDTTAAYKTLNSQNN